MLKTTVALMLILAMFVPFAFAGLGSRKAEYVGGTVTSIKEGTEGDPSSKDDKVYTFTYPGGKLTIPYDRVDSLEYGQKAGRRVGVAIMVSPIALFSKKRKHFLTISWKDDNDKQQAAVFEIGKEIIRTELAALEARTGRKVEYQDDEARKSSKGN
ncbi:MAG TPA: hypothetical protein VEB03_01075 [Candidatus Nanoarchaeia archaeon]|nr:hypothetical protein [Candidatus Nanoarchaeia archaeon]